MYGKQLLIAYKHANVYVRFGVDFSRIEKWPIK